MIVQHTSYGNVVVVDREPVYKDYDDEQELIDEVNNLRKDLIALIYDNEHDDSIPMKTYRIHSASLNENIMSITINARTRLGAIIGFADRDQKRIESDSSLKNLEGLGLWFEFVSGHSGGIDINEYAQDIMDRCIFIVEVQDEKITFLP